MPSKSRPASTDLVMVTGTTGGRSRCVQRVLTEVCQAATKNCSPRCKIKSTKYTDVHLNLFISIASNFLMQPNVTPLQPLDLNYMDCSGVVI